MTPQWFSRDKDYLLFQSQRFIAEFEGVFPVTDAMEYQCSELGVRIQFSTENGVYLRTMDEEVIDAMSAGGLARFSEQATASAGTLPTPQQCPDSFLVRPERAVVQPKQPTLASASHGPRAAMRLAAL